MTIKEFGENAEITVEVRIFVNDQVAFIGKSYDIDGAIGELNRAERHHIIQQEVENQYVNLPELIEDEDRGLSYED